MPNKVPSNTSVEEQRRLTLSTRLALGASRFSDSVVEYLMQNENQNEITQIIDLVAYIGRDQRFALLKAAEQGSLGLSRMALPSEWAQEGERFWKDEYGIKTDFAGLQIPTAPMNARTPHTFILMPEKASQVSEMLYQSDAKAYDKIWKFTDKSLDELGMTHKLTGTFGFWVEDVGEAPDGLVGGINLSTAAVDDIGWATETLPMRQVHGRKYWREHGIHLDQGVITFCAGSRLPDGLVPTMNFSRFSDKVCVYANIPQYAYDDVRFRRAVV